MAEVDWVLGWIFPELTKYPTMPLPRRFDASQSEEGNSSVNLMYSCPSRFSWVENFDRASYFGEEEIKGNPHTWQRLCDPLSSHLPAKLPDFTRTLSTESFERVYRRRYTDTIKSVVHWGQRKLLLSEIEFLTEFTNAGNLTILYVGAGPGHHIPLLMSLFRKQVRRWIFYDSTPFSFSSSENVEIYNRYFSDEDACNLKIEKDSKLLFICDIRNLSHGRLEASESERAVTDDMRMQERWVKLMRPYKSMLKFRLPYVAGSSTYLKGELRLPVWGPQTTTEVRLIVDEAAESYSYDHQKHWQQMFYFNTVTRVMVYPCPVKADRTSRLLAGLCGCYDCTAEMSILKGYLEATQSSEDVLVLSQSVSMSLGKFCSRKFLTDLA